MRRLTDAERAEMARQRDERERASGAWPSWAHRLINALIAGIIGGLVAYLLRDL